MSDLPIIDSEAIANLKELNPGDNGEFLREIVAIYAEDTPKRIADMKTFMASGDVPSFTRAAHTIKGSSANVGAARVKAVAERLEHLSRRESLPALAAQVAECETEFLAASEELRKISAT